MRKITLVLLISLALSASRVSVHDPSITLDKGTYYVFGSHIATAKSTDLINWQKISGDYESPTGNVIYRNLQKNLAKSFKWAGYNDGDCSGGGYGVWGPDVIYNADYEWSDGSKGAYMLYYSASSTWRRSCIGYMVSKRIDGGYSYVDTIIYSGFTNTGKTNYDGNSSIDTTYSKSYLNIKTLMNQGTIDSNVKTWSCFNSDGSWNEKYAPNAIDPTLFYNADGKRLFMVYGSWSGGIFILELDKKTGQPLYPGKDGKEEKSGNFVDRYFGTHIAGANHQSGEGSFILYDQFTKYYWLYLTYGGLTTTGGYNMRLFRSTKLFGPYVDPAGRMAQNSGVDVYKYGVKLIGNYQFSGQPGYRSAGHNSAYISDDGKYYLIFHQRFLDSSKGEYHEVRVRQQFLNEDDWLCTAVYEYKGEKITKFSESHILGTYELINHGNAEKDGSMLKTYTIKIEKGGTVSGDQTGTWSIKDGSSYTYLNIKLGSITYKGVLFRQYDDNNVSKMTFTAIGHNNLAVWGSSTFVSPSKATIADGWYYIKNPVSGKYLTAHSNSAVSPNNIEIATKKSLNSQKWKLTNLSDGYVSLQSKLGNYLIDLENGSTDDGTNIRMFTNIGGDAQEYVIQKSVQSNAYTIGTKNTRGQKVFDIENGSTRDGANVRQWPVNGLAAQLWTFEAV